MTATARLEPQPYVWVNLNSNATSLTNYAMTFEACRSTLSRLLADVAMIDVMEAVSPAGGLAGTGIKPE